MGQLKSRLCPVCDGPNDGKWTCEGCTKLVDVHRALLRNLQHWHSLYEASEISDTLVAADRQSYCLWDVDSFYGQRTRLPERQRASMELCLFENVAERDAALRMGIAASNPVCVYATVGLTRLLAWAVRGELDGYPVSLDLSATLELESQPS